MGGTRSKLFVLAGALAVIVAGATAAPARPTPDTGLYGISSSEPGLAARGAGWSPERFAEAEPIPLLAPTNGTPANEWIEPGGTVRFSPAVAPEGEPSAAADLSPAVTGPRHQTEGYSYPAPYTQYRLRPAEAKQFPLRAVGKLFLIAPDGTGGECSAASIGNQAIWTAGHCVHVGGGGIGGFMTEGYFIPAYDGTKACPGQGCPYGVWEVNQFWAPNQWVNRGNSHFDFGGAILLTLNGKTISQRVGSLGFVSNVSNIQHYHSFGWPARAPFTGHKLEACIASSAYTFSWGTAGNPDTAIGCNMTPGCSGGPWIVDYRGGSYVNGVNSVRRVLNGVEFGDEMMSPYFGDAAWDLLQVLLNTTAP